MATDIAKVPGDDFFTSVNAYDGMQCLVADNPEDLCALINAIKRPIKIYAFQSFGSRQVAYFVGDFKIKKPTKKGTK